MQLLLRWAVATAALYGTVWLLGVLGLAKVANVEWYAWFLLVLVMGLVNALIRPLAQMLTAPLNCLTFGIVGVLVNALLFWLVPVLGDAVGLNVFRVDFLGALVGSLLVSAIGGLLNMLITPDRERV
jgi:putative membrane protein